MSSLDSRFNMSSSESESEEVLFDKVVKKCNWCGNTAPLVNNKHYCLTCDSNKVRECTRCHRPFPEMKYFKLNNNRCNSCQKKLDQEKNIRAEKRKVKLQQLEDAEQGTKKFKKPKQTPGAGASDPEFPPESVSEKERKLQGYIPVYAFKNI